jgi:hypothetical protein
MRWSERLEYVTEAAPGDFIRDLRDQTDPGRWAVERSSIRGVTRRASGGKC